MTFLGASLADGQVAAAWAAIYTVPIGKRAILRSADFFQKNAITQILQLRITRSGGTPRFFPQVANLLQNESVRYLTDGEVLVLSAGDALEAQTTTAASVEYTITGAEE